MKIEGTVWKSRKDGMWLAEIPFLNLMVQATTKEEIPEMAKDALELLIEDTTCAVDITLIGNTLYVEASDQKKIISLILKRQ